MKVGLVGFAGSGKTTVFNTMTGLDVPVGFGGEVRLGVSSVPDARLDELSRVYSPRKTTYTEIAFCDVPGEHGAEKTGLSPRALQRIRDQQALCLVLRDFPNVALDAPPDPEGDLEAFHAECVLSDLEAVERRLDRAQRERTDPREVASFETMRAALEEERPLRSLSEEELRRDYLRGYGLISERPLLVVLNREEERAAEPLPPDLQSRLVELHSTGLALSASLEAEIAGLEEEDQAAFLEDLGIGESALSRFVRASYELLDLISFFTVRGDEVRAWTVRRGTSARAAAGKVHSDMERGFIRAEVIPFETFVAHGSERAVKEAGHLQVEGRDYVVKDGDIMRVLFNV